MQSASAVPREGQPESRPTTSSLRPLLQTYRVDDDRSNSGKTPQLNCKILYVKNFSGGNFEAFNDGATTPSSSKYNTNVASSSHARRDNGETSKDFSKNLPLYQDILQGNWEETEKLVKEDKTICKAPLNEHLQTLFHVAAEGDDENAREVEKILKDMSEKDLEIKDRNGRTALHVAALCGNLDMAKVFVLKNYKLLYHIDYHGDLPIHLAARNTRDSKLVYRYFFRVTQDNNNNNEDHNAGEMVTTKPYEGSSAMQLYCYLIGSKFFDLALELVIKYDDLAGLESEICGSESFQKNPDVARHPLLNSKTSALHALVQFVCPLIIPSPLSLWQRLIYYLIPPKSMKENILMHKQVSELFRFLCEKLKTIKNHKQVVSLVKNAMFEAARMDMDETIIKILKAYPPIVYCLDDKKQSIFQIAVENRSEKVFNLISCKNVYKHDLVEMVDVNGNDILHLVGKLAPQHKLNRVSGAALQMQRELQWFQAVEKVAPSYFPSTRNNEGKTPRMVFIEEHKKLKEEGEKLMKDTANSCTIAAALIVTIAFAAAITVPGGTNSDNGHPIFTKKSAFTVFAVANAASLFTSATSLLVFLSILTSRYAEEDFLHSLPRRSIIGLLTLFLSIIFMMTAFSATVYLVFCQNQSMVLLLVAALACLPITSFVLLQFPLIVALISSTYGPGILKKSNKFGH